jgi:hypothetical protein
MTAAQIDIHLPAGLEDPSSYSDVHDSRANRYSPTRRSRRSIRLQPRAWQLRKSIFNHRKHPNIHQGQVHGSVYGGRSYKHMDWLGTKHDMYAQNCKHGHFTHLVACFYKPTSKKWFSQFRSYYRAYIYGQSDGHVYTTRPFLLTNNYVGRIVFTMVQTLADHNVFRHSICHSKHS